MILFATHCLFCCPLLATDKFCIDASFLYSNHVPEKKKDFRDCGPLSGSRAQPPGTILRLLNLSLHSHKPQCWLSKALISAAIRSIITQIKGSVSFAKLSVVGISTSCQIWDDAIRVFLSPKEHDNVKTTGWDQSYIVPRVHSNRGQAFYEWLDYSRKSQILRNWAPFHLFTPAESLAESVKVHTLFSTKIW